MRQHYAGAKGVAERCSALLLRRRPMSLRFLALHAVAIACFVLLSGLEPAMALSLRECSAKYRAAKASGALGGLTWQQFRKSNCGAAAVPDSAAAAPRTAPSMAFGPGVVFPKEISPKYANEPAGRARLHTCLDQYRANKQGNANGGLRWIVKGGGYYSECNKRLKG
jgi:hypothetical protein